MDPGELEQDVKLYRTSPELLGDFKTSLEPFLWKTSKSGKRLIRSRVRIRDTDRLVALLEPHQDNPQLLDPHLNDFVPRLRDAFIAFLRSRPARPAAALHPKLLIPLSRAICRLLYTLCKIRGEKVIVQFLSTDTGHIELLLSALENESPSDHRLSNRQTEYQQDGAASVVDARSQYGDSSPVNPIVAVEDTWGWEERYITLLWLSLLIMNPFDLDSISSGATTNEVQNSIPNLTLPPGIPGIPLRIIPLAIHYLASPAKESAAAKTLLVRVARRKDMQENGVSHSLTQWAISSLQVSSNLAESDHFYVGILSFLAGLLGSSVNTSDMDPYLWDIHQIFQETSADQAAFMKRIHASSLARKITIKVQRSLCALVLRNPSIRDSDDMLNSIIGFTLDSLGDAFTPVRLASSKALSVLASKMPPEMAEEIIDEVLAALKKGRLMVGNGLQVERYDLSGINPPEWHGLILTLSHLLYRRSPPPNTLSGIISALLLGLSFERRSSSGSSIGSNVRDAACFGIWSLARRYTTDELEAVIPDSSLINGWHGQSSIIQIMASELIVSASLDPERNIRRGCSAALQELIGRHPDTVAEGLAIVQTVDYHAVPLRSNAVLHVAREAARLSKSYWLGISHSLLGWRGVGDPDPSARRIAATAFGNIFWIKLQKSDHVSPWAQFHDVAHELRDRIQKLKLREVHERHGLLLCMASAVDRMKHYPLDKNSSGSGVADILDFVELTLKDAQTSTYRRPDLIAEATSRLIQATCSLLGVGVVARKPFETSNTEPIEDSSSFILGSTTSASPFDMLGVLTSTEGSAAIYQAHTSQIDEIFGLAKPLLSQWLRWSEPEVIEAASDATVNLLVLLSKSQRQNMIYDLINVIADGQGRRTSQDKGVLSVLFIVFPIADSLQPAIIQAVRAYWTTAHDIDSRVAFLQCLTKSSFASSMDFAHIISEGLDDYTTNARGDVGSLVRIEAIKAAGAIWKDAKKVESWHESEYSVFSELFGKVLRLACEKLDKVRIEAQRSIGYLVSAKHLLFSGDRESLNQMNPSSREYFSFFLNMETRASLASRKYEDHWRLEMFEGYVISADTGSEDIIRASRSALAEYCESENADLVCSTLFLVLKRNLKNDRVLVPTLEAIAFLFDIRIMQKSSTNWRELYRLVQNAHYKTGNTRKLEAAVRVYGGLVEVYPEALDKLTKMLLHPIPTLRNKVADTLFTVRGVGKGVNWLRARKEDLRELQEELGIQIAT